MEANVNRGTPTGALDRFVAVMIRPMSIASAHEVQSVVYVEEPKRGCMSLSVIVLLLHLQLLHGRHHH